MDELEGAPTTAAAMPGSASGRRRCDACARPLGACICRWVTPVATAVDLLILQHPMEVNNAKGSARLLHMSVAASRLVEGECFDPQALHAMLYDSDRIPVLLYPQTAGEHGLGLPAPPPFEAALCAAPSRLLLVVLDGTWRKSRKMLYQNRLLQLLPRLPLTAMPASQYPIRKAHAPDQRSTLEASCYALGQLEGDGARFAPLLASFERFVAQFAATGGRLGTQHDGRLAGAGNGQ